MIAVLALALRTVLDGGVTGPAITFAVVFGLLFALVTAAFERAGHSPAGHPDGEYARTIQPSRRSPAPSGALSTGLSAPAVGAGAPPPPRRLSR